MCGSLQVEPTIIASPFPQMPSNATNVELGMRLGAGLETKPLLLNTLSSIRERLGLQLDYYKIVKVTWDITPFLMQELHLFRHMEEEGDQYCWMMFSVMVMRGHCWSVAIQLLEITTVGITRTPVLPAEAIVRLLLHHQYTILWWVKSQAYTHKMIPF